MKHVSPLVFAVFAVLNAGAQITNPVPGGIPGQPTPPQPVVPKNPDGKIVLDDSTKQIYGPRTTRYFLEPDLFNNRKTLYPIDTNLVGFHQYEWVKRSGHRLTDLGNLGTATRPTYYEPPQRIGAQIGFNAFDPYAFTPESIRYFDTKSPFSNIYYVQGGRGQSILNFDFSRNINPRLNFGLDLQRITAEKQYALANVRTQTQRNQTDSWAFALHGSYRSKNERYTLLSHVRLLEQNVAELGGLLLGRAADADSIFQFRLTDALARTPTARTRERRNNLHTYQQYVLANGFQVYHIFDVEGRYNRFRDPNYTGGSPDSTGYPRADSDVAFDTLVTETNYRLFENRFGVKGFFKGFNYRLHVRRRDYQRLNQFSQTQVGTDSVALDQFGATFNYGRAELDYLRRSETFLGLWLNYYFPDSTRIWAEGEYLLGRDYLLRGEYEGRWLRAGASSLLSSPTLVQERFVSPLLSWDNRFGLVSSQSAWGRAIFRLGRLTLEPNASYHLLKNYIFFNTRGVPEQTGVPISIFRAGTGLSFKAGLFSTVSEVQLATTSEPDFVRIPKILANSRLAFDVLFKKKLYIQTGLELHYRSGYFADAYLPLTGQFYLQNSFRVPGFLLADAFADLRINRVRLFFKAANLTQALTQRGYFPTPYYPGVPFVPFGFGVNWLLFD